MKTLIPLFIFFACNGEKTKDLNLDNSLKQDTISLINKDKNTIKERFLPPENFVWMEEKPDSFGYFIENFPLKSYGSRILKFDGTEIATQNLHEAIFDIDVGNRDLQQCADAVIRLRAEYLFKTKQFGEIKFHFTSGDLATWNDYKNGIRAFVNGNNVSFQKTQDFDDSYQNFRNYLDLVFSYAGTISLNRETFPVSAAENLKTGDILITPGSPGHVVFIVGVCKNSEGKKLYLLGEGFTPAQSIHVLANPFRPEISPWYELDMNADEIKTARYFFDSANFRRF
ncbi:MAG: DUF4846 domain-containing protein [Flavobacteriaceae bacterium]|jgi:hypothetical protein|nr:DUF4846 domain-containing protein [Flavobacteriaceae bacterium]